MENKRRFEFITDAKTAAVVLVVMLHCMLFYAKEEYYTERASFSSDTVEFICSILFASLVSSLVCCSGFLFANSVLAKNSSVGSLIKTRAKRLLLRYFVYGALWLVPTYVLFDISCYGRDKGASLLDSFKAMVLGVFSDHLWFLLMLFWVSLVFTLMVPLIKKDLLPVVAVITIVLALVVEFYCTFDYFKISQISAYLPCFLIGVCLYRWKDGLGKLPSPALWVITAVLFVITLFYQDYAEKYFLNYWFFKAVGALFMVFLFMALDRIPSLSGVREIKAVSFARKNSLTFYLLNCPFIYIYFRILAPLVEKNIIICVLANFVLSMISLFIMAWFIEICKTQAKRVLKHEQN